MGTWVYVLQCEEEAWYVGITQDLERRMEQHFTGQGSFYTKWYTPLKLVWSKEYDKGRAEYLEDWITVALQRRALKVGGGKLSNPWFNGREWSKENSELVRWAKKQIGKSLHVVNRTLCRRGQRSAAALQSPCPPTIVYSVKEWRLLHGLPRTKKGKLWTRKKPKVRK